MGYNFRRLREKIKRYEKQLDTCISPPYPDTDLREIDSGITLTVKQMIPNDIVNKILPDQNDFGGYHLSKFTNEMSGPSYVVVTDLQYHEEKELRPFHLSEVDFSPIYQDWKPSMDLAGGSVVR